MPTVGERLRAATALLADAGIEGASREAEALAAFALGVGRAALAARRRDPFAGSALERFERAVARRAAREPTQYIIGRERFRNLNLRVGPQALIPRPETEGLVEAVLALGLRGGATVADLGTGTGCIAIALADERSDVRVCALEVSPAALELARANAAEAGLAHRIEFALGSMADPPSAWIARCDAVVSNPPYVSEDDWRGLEPEVRDHEPKAALVPGPTGLEAYDPLADAARRLLVPGGTLVAELGYDSEPGARAAVVRAGLRVVRVEPDFRGIARVLIARRTEGAS